MAAAFRLPVPAVSGAVVAGVRLHFPARHRRPCTGPGRRVLAGDHLVPRPRAAGLVAGIVWLAGRGLARPLPRAPPRDPAPLQRVPVLSTVSRRAGLHLAEAMGAPVASDLPAAPTAVADPVSRLRAGAILRHHLARQPRPAMALPPTVSARERRSEGASVLPARLARRHRNRGQRRPVHGPAVSDRAGRGHRHRRSHLPIRQDGRDDPIRGLLRPRRRQSRHRGLVTLGAHQERQQIR